MNSQSFPETGAGRNQPAISEAEFQALIEMVGPEMPEVVVDLLDTYVEESTGLVAAIRTGVENGDHASILRPAHSLKSSSASIGAMQLSRFCADLETHLRGSLPGLDVPTQAKRIDAEFSRVREALAVQRSKLLL
jgi:HPt (histidine-containing phosphotransfer) domain-containing protein